MRVAAWFRFWRRSFTATMKLAYDSSSISYLGLASGFSVDELPSSDDYAVFFLYLSGGDLFSTCFRMA
jgi:hypothetical protein